MLLEDGGKKVDDEAVSKGGGGPTGEGPVKPAEVASPIGAHSDDVLVPSHGLPVVAVVVGDDGVVACMEEQGRDGNVADLLPRRAEVVATCGGKRELAVKSIRAVDAPPPLWILDLLLRCCTTETNVHAGGSGWPTLGAAGASSRKRRPGDVAKARLPVPSPRAHANELREQGNVSVIHDVRSKAPGDGAKEVSDPFQANVVLSGPQDALGHVRCQNALVHGVLGLLHEVVGADKVQAPGHGDGGDNGSLPPGIRQVRRQHKPTCAEAHCEDGCFGVSLRDVVHHRVHVAGVHPLEPPVREDDRAPGATCSSDYQPLHVGVVPGAANAVEDQEDGRVHRKAFHGLFLLAIFLPCRVEGLLGVRKPLPDGCLVHRSDGRRERASSRGCGRGQQVEVLGRSGSAHRDVSALQTILRNNEGWRPRVGPNAY
mmetsp:Transcript_12831/g.37257  ORF Transcript_12831/g.37257 Transcript_12831/m.37257 type:complete len:428 (-) Transcript_12831:338-1621(-)